MTNEEIEKELPKEVDKFWNEITKGPFNNWKKYLKEIQDWKNSECLNCNNEKTCIFKDALYQGYLDACRTITWTDEEIKNYNDKKKRCYVCEKLDKAAQMIRSYFLSDDMKGEKDFNGFHHKLCKELKDDFGEEAKFTYGHAQKIINMAFKYLYCVFSKVYEAEFRDKFKDCHMPLDSFSLEWLYRAYIKKKKLAEKYKLTGKESSECLEATAFKGEYIKKEAINSWSTLEYEHSGKPECTYSFYVDLLQCETKKIPFSPLELDFYVWPRIQKIRAAEEFMKTFKNENSDDYNYEIAYLESVLEQKLNEVRNIICCDCAQL